MPLHSGTYVALVPSDSLAGLTVIIETLNNVGGCLERNMSFVDLGFTTRGGLPGPGTVLHVWATTETAYVCVLRVPRPPPPRPVQVIHSPRVTMPRPAGTLYSCRTSPSARIARSRCACRRTRW